MNSKTYFFDIILCVFVIPGMMFLFPIGEWAQWHAGYVLLYALWLYAVYFLCRFLIGPLFVRGKKMLVSAFGLVFLIAAITFLMTLTRVEIPYEPGIPIQGHVSAMWIMLLAVLGISIPFGAKAVQVQELQSELSATTESMGSRSELQRRAYDALGAASISVNSGYKKIQVPLVSIRYLEGRNNHVCIHVENGEDIVTQKTMKDFLQMLPDGKFVRIHRSYAVPRWRILESSTTQVRLMDIQDPLPVGRAYKNLLRG